MQSVLINEWLRIMVQGIMYGGFVYLAIYFANSLINVIFNYSEVKAEYVEWWQKVRRKTGTKGETVIDSQHTAHKVDI